MSQIAGLPLSNLVFSVLSFQIEGGYFLVQTSMIGSLAGVAAGVIAGEGFFNYLYFPKKYTGGGGNLQNARDCCEYAGQYAASLPSVRLYCARLVPVGRLCARLPQVFPPGVWQSRHKPGQHSPTRPDLLLSLPEHLLPNAEPGKSY